MYVMPSVRFSVTVPKNLMEKFERVASEVGYRKRSRAVQEAIRAFLSEHRWVEGEGSFIGVILVLFDHEVRGSEEALTDIQHSHEELVKSTLHVHLTHRMCLEVVVVEGRAEELRSLSKRFRAVKGVETVRFIGMPIGG